MPRLRSCTLAGAPLLLALLCCAPLAAQTRQWSAPATPPAAAPTAPARAAAVGEKVLVSSAGSWYGATVLEVGSDGYKVRYDGWGSGWDEWVAPARMKRADGSTIAAPPQRPAPVRPEPPATPPTRPATPAPPASPPAPPPATRPSPTRPAAPPAVWSTSPVGLWKCRTWDYSQVNVVGEFTLKADGSYHDAFARAGGRYTFDRARSRIAFTSGPQRTSAPVTFFPEGHAGKGHLQFDYGGGARLDCYREALK